jgi:hypothetical protein
MVAMILKILRLDHLGQLGRIHPLNGCPDIEGINTFMAPLRKTN